MKTPHVLVALLSAAVLSLTVVGCSHTVSETKTTKVRSDGTMSSKETTVTQNADGTVTKKEETKKTSR